MMKGMWDWLEVGNTNGNSRVISSFYLCTLFTLSIFLVWAYIEDNVKFRFGGKDSIFEKKIQKFQKSKKIFNIIEFWNDFLILN